VAQRRALEAKQAETKKREGDQRDQDKTSPALSGNAAKAAVTDKRLTEGCGPSSSCAPLTARTEHTYFRKTFRSQRIPNEYRPLRHISRSSEPGGSLIHRKPQADTATEPSNLASGSEDWRGNAGFPDEAPTDRQASPVADED